LSAAAAREAASPPLGADAIVVAAGRSSRMAGTDKVFATVAGRPLLAWTLDALAAVDEVERIVVVTAAERVDAVRAAQWLPGSVVAVIAGGDRRQTSVLAGLTALEGAGPAGPIGDPDQRVILVHDGARPLVSADLVRDVIRAATTHGAAIPALPVAETLKRIDGDRVAGTVERDGLAAAQTPQGIRAGLFRAALERYPADGPETWTDEASLLEACTIAVHVVPGDPSNLKVTLPADLERVALALSHGTVRRTGIGQDSHPFGAGSPLALGGIRIAGAPRLHGHSDGDAALHAVSDAILGAAGMGDLGALFPAGPSTPAGVDSRTLLAAVVERAAAGGWRVESLDLTIIAARPRLGGHLAAMRDAIARLTALEPGAVNVKASTGNLDGSEGAGRTVSALAVATLAATPSGSGS
jgi:2-C-methyl-D-erythritol 4-phosphate cytidylyltransferase / 2-C-methyl-D-erythritol 2,4-cyclodiphosphate synthase